MRNERYRPTAWVRELRIKCVRLNSGYNVAQLEYEQLEQQYDNEKEVLAAEYKVQELDFSIFRKGLAEMKRTLDDAQDFAHRVKLFLPI